MISAVGGAANSSGPAISNSSGTPGAPAQPSSEGCAGTTERFFPNRGSPEANVESHDVDETAPNPESGAVDQNGAQGTTQVKEASNLDSSAITKLKQKIRNEQTKIDRKEGTIIESFVCIGKFLAELRGHIKTGWAKNLKALQIHPRVASRYMQLAASSLAEIGLNESDLLPRLPTDLLKLEWLCRLNREQLRKLLLREDVKKAPRNRVTALVKDILGTPSDETPAHGPEAKINKLFQRLLTLAGEAIEKTNEAGDSSRIRDLLGNGVRQIEQLLKGGQASQ
jgi:hypothetical protein